MKKEDPKVDMVNEPPHYKTESGLQAIDVIEAFGFGEGFRMGTLIKYVLRAGKKGDRKEDLRKAEWYLRREIEKGNHAPHSKPNDESMMSRSEARQDYERAVRILAKEAASIRKQHVILDPNDDYCEYCKRFGASPLPFPSDLPILLPIKIEKEPILIAELSGDRHVFEKLVRFYVRTLTEKIQNEHLRGNRYKFYCKAFGVRPAGASFDKLSDNHVHMMEIPAAIPEIQVEES